MCVSCPTAPHRETSVLFVCCTVQVILWRLESTLSALPPLSQIQRWLPGALTLHVSLGQLFSLSFNTVFSSQMEGLDTCICLQVSRLVQALAFSGRIFEQRISYSQHLAALLPESGVSLHAVSLDRSHRKPPVEL